MYAKKVINIDHYYELWEERAAIIHYDSNIPLYTSEKRAYFEIAREYCHKKQISLDSKDASDFKIMLKQHIQSRRLSVCELNLVKKND